MKLKNCSECGKVCLENPRGLCPDCIAQEDQDALKVMEYLREVQKASVQKIHEETGVKEKIILRMMHHGLIIGDFEIGYPCENCGIEIYEGRLCSKCNHSLLNQISPRNTYTEKTLQESSRQQERMHLANRLWENKK